MKSLKSHFWYTKRQRNGILFLVLIILLLQLAYFFVDFSSGEPILDSSEINTYQKQIDSLKETKIENSKPKIYPFNPNFLTDFKAYKIGLTVAEIDKLLAFRKTGKYVNSAKEFQKVTGVSDSLLLVISPYFKFPEWVKVASRKKTSNKKKRNKITSTIEKKDLNTATITDLKLVNGIGEKLAKRIITYRDLLKGYTYNQQLYEVYYLDKEVANRVLDYFTVLKKPTIEKLNINDATFKEILHTPYINYDLTKRIVNYRNVIFEYETIEDLKKIDSFPLEKYDRIVLYLTTD